MRLTLAITTYERPSALAAVMHSVAAQVEPPDEVIIADDGSGASTRAVIDTWRARLRVPLYHAWQEKRGFRLTRARNMAIARARGEFIVFVDGDMLLHPEFIADHRRAARTGFFTQGVRILLDARRTASVLAEPKQPIGPWSDGLAGLRRLYAIHAPAAADRVRLIANPLIAIKGCNQGFWRSDLIAANGFDEAIEGWGPEDKELCARLAHAGVRRQTLLFGGIACHLHHAAAPRERRTANEAILRRTLAARSTRCERGLQAHLQRSANEPA